MTYQSIFSYCIDFIATEGKALKAISNLASTVIWSVAFFKVSQDLSVQHHRATGVFISVSCLHGMVILQPCSLKLLYFFFNDR